MKCVALTAIALALVVCHADRSRRKIPNNDKLIEKLIKKYIGDAEKPDKEFLRYLLENLNKRLTLGGAREGLKDIVGKKFPNATTFEQYREALFKNVTTVEKGFLYGLNYNLGIDVVNTDLATFNLTAQAFFSEDV